MAGAHPAHIFCASTLPRENTTANVRMVLAPPRVGKQLGAGRSHGEQRARRLRKWSTITGSRPATSTMKVAVKKMEEYKVHCRLAHEQGRPKN